MIGECHNSECGIVYCSSRFECESLSFHLVESCFTAAPYHASFSDIEREFSQGNWMAGLCQIIWATSAFGMGVNKPNLEFVYHLTMPSSLSYYYQECGRSGQDGSLASSVMFYNFSNLLFFKRLSDGME
ncbi:ATP-dependent DNA helicase Q-like 4A [Daphnia pulex]|uniref:ATP-dependent DNA helicase Q-like 4A n=1 Tax=Daphnia pulex TaxID=6669 RepID=UPI001EE04574|nr:ATP-dependent DNA helicase Q-like 4A [Daphnia pulex]